MVQSPEKYPAGRVFLIQFFRTKLPPALDRVLSLDISNLRRVIHPPFTDNLVEISFGSHESLAVLRVDGDVAVELDSRGDVSQSCEDRRAIEVIVIKP
jgi:hypothetical protein